MDRFGVRMRATTQARVRAHCEGLSVARTEWVGDQAHVWLTVHQDEPLPLADFEGSASVALHDGDRELLRNEARRRGMSFSQLLDQILVEVLDRTATA